MDENENTQPTEEVQVDQEKRIKDFCVEMSSSMLRSEAERDFRKEAVARLSEQIGIDKAVLNFCARTYHKQDFGEKMHAMDEQRDFYVRIFGEPEGNNSSDEDVDED